MHNLGGCQLRKHFYPIRNQFYGCIETVQKSAIQRIISHISLIKINVLSPVQDDRIGVRVSICEIFIVIGCSGIMIRHLSPLFTHLWGLFSLIGQMFHFSGSTSNWHSTPDFYESPVLCFIWLVIGTEGFQLCIWQRGLFAVVMVIQFMELLPYLQRQQQNNRNKSVSSYTFRS